MIVLRLAGIERRFPGSESVVSPSPGERTCAHYRLESRAACTPARAACTRRAERAVVAEDGDRDISAAARRDQADVLVVLVAIVGKLPSGMPGSGMSSSPVGVSCPLEPLLRLTWVSGTMPSCSGGARFAAGADRGRLRGVEREVVVGRKVREVHRDPRPGRRHRDRVVVDRAGRGQRRHLNRLVPGVGVDRGRTCRPCRCPGGCRPTENEAMLEWDWPPAVMVSVACVGPTVVPPYTWNVSS